MDTTRPSDVPWRPETLVCMPRWGRPRSQMESGATTASTPLRRQAAAGLGGPVSGPASLILTCQIPRTNTERTARGTECGDEFSSVCDRMTLPTVPSLNDLALGMDISECPPSSEWTVGRTRRRDSAQVQSARRNRPRRKSDSKRARGHADHRTVYSSPRYEHHWAHPV